MSLFSAAENANLLEDTGGEEVKKGLKTTSGHVDWGPAQALTGREGWSGVQTTARSVTIAAGTLDGVTTEDGIDDAVEIRGRRYRIVQIESPEGEDGGDLLLLLLKPA